MDGILPGTVDRLRTSRCKTHEGLQEVFAQWQRDKKSFKEVFAAEKSGYREKLIASYREHSLKRALIPAQIMRGQMPSLDEILPSMAETQMFSLQHLFQVHPVDKNQSIEMLREFLVSVAIDEAPFSVIEAAMYASLSRKAASGQKRMPNQGTANDFEIVSTLLPYCDAMFMDNECSALWHDIPKSHKLPYPCRMFSREHWYGVHSLPYRHPRFSNSGTPETCRRSLWTRPFETSTEHLQSGTAGGIIVMRGFAAFRRPAGTLASARVQVSPLSATGVISEHANRRSATRVATRQESESR